MDLAGQQKNFRSARHLPVNTEEQAWEAARARETEKGGGGPPRAGACHAASTPIGES